MSEDEMKIPQFPTEAAEAEWWANNQDLLMEEFERAGASGTLTTGSVARRATRIDAAAALPAGNLSPAAAAPLHRLP